MDIGFEKKRSEPQVVYKKAELIILFYFKSVAEQLKFLGCPIGP